MIGAFRGKRRSRRHLLTAIFASTAAVALHVGAASAENTCDDLVNFVLPDTAITIAQFYSKGKRIVGMVDAPVDLCRVAGTVKPSSDSNIKFEVWIPTDGSFNGNYEQIGNGGYAGNIWMSYIANAVSRGYAAAATDDGTSGPPLGAATFLGHPDVQIDYGYRAIKMTSDNAKAIIEKLSGHRPYYSYFTGCSDGGREALMEVQRYPNDFDGIIAGSPANDLVGLGMSFLWNTKALFGGPQTDGVPDAYIPANKLALLSGPALSQCVGKDGGISTDAFLNDPSACHFDPSVVLCQPGQDPGVCLTPAQVGAAAKLYRGPHNRNGELVFPGYEPGSESNPANWPQWLVGTSSTSPGMQSALTSEFWCDEVMGNAGCDVLGIRHGFLSAVEIAAPIVNSTNPDLSEFRNRGGKIIQYAGWADTAIAPENGLNYYRKVESVMGDIQGFYRVFMAPGMAHCYGGAGPNSFGNGTSDGPVIDAEHDILKALERWVEFGIAPNKIVATKYLDDDPANGIAFQRPLCPYPQISRYDGHGNTSGPAKFECTSENVPFAPANADIQAAYR